MKITFGLKPVDKIIEGLESGSFIQIVGDYKSDISAIGLNILRNAKMPVYFSLNGMLNYKMAEKVVGSFLTVIDHVDNIFEILIDIVKNNAADVIIIDDIPSVVGTKEQTGDGDEYDTIEQLSRVMLRARIYCIRNNITIVWLNQIRMDDITGLRIYGANTICRKMPVTILCEERRIISKSGRFIGKEYALRIIRSNYNFANRRTFIGIIDGIIDEKYWLFNEAMRYGIITRNPVTHKYIFNGNEYKMWSLIDNMNNYQEEIEREIGAKEKIQQLYR